MTPEPIMKKRISTGSKGEFYKDPLKQGQRWLKDQFAAGSKLSRFFRNFNRTFTKNVMTTYDDVDFLFINQLYLNDLDAGNVKVAFEDNLVDLAWEIGAQTGNIKDLDATQEANTKTWMQKWLLVTWNLVAQSMRRPLTTAMAESSTGDNDNTNCYNWNQADWDAFIQACEKLDCPDMVYRFMAPFLWIIRVTDTYERSGVTIPPSYFIPIFDYKENQLSEMQTLINEAKAVSANAMVHCRKYGIPFSKFSFSKLNFREVIPKTMFEDVDILAYFNICPFTYTIDTPANVRRDHAAILSGANLTTDYSQIIHLFDRTKDQSILRAMFPMFGPTYDATNNPYANIFTPLATAGATEYQVNMIKVKNLGTSWTVAQIDDAYHILKWFLAYYHENLQYGPAWTGTDVTLSTKYIDERAHPAFDLNNNVYMDTGHVVGQEHLDSCVQAMKHIIYGT